MQGGLAEKRFQYSEISKQINFKNKTPDPLIHIMNNYKS